MSKLAPQYTAWEAIHTALALAARALEEVRSVARTPGPAGKEGLPGKDGAAGKMPIVREWTDGSVHYQSDVVVHGGSTYQALRDTAKAPPHDDWRCLASSGRDGLSFNIRGTYAEAETYRTMDVVALNYASFAARKDNPGPCPGDGWQLIAGQGKQGKPGDRGPSGNGTRGEPGQAVVAIDVDANGLLRLTNGDGSVVSCDLYPLLAKLG